MIVLHLASKHQGAGWHSYDRQFHQHQAAGDGLSWADLNPSHPCSLCLSAYQSKDDCALASLYATAKGTEMFVNHHVCHFQQPRRPIPYSSASSGGVCYHFNWGTCLASHCRFEHFCSNSQKTSHPAIRCPEPKSGSNER